jgi:hypothetical protein
VITKLISVIKNACHWVKHRLQHKLEHISLQELKDAIVKGGIPLLVIVVGWEIIEDIIFPIVFWWLGNKIHPAFYSVIPVSWLLCLHWLIVPILWRLWMKISKK